MQPELMITKVRRKEVVIKRNSSGRQAQEVKRQSIRIYSDSSCSAGPASPGLGNTVGLGLAGTLAKELQNSILFNHGQNPLSAIGSPSSPTQRGPVGSPRPALL